MSAANQPYCLTIGDPTGIGPEITARFLNETGLLQGHRLIVLGDIQNLIATADQLGLSLPDDGAVDYYEILNRDCRLPGQIAHRSVCEAVRLIATGAARALVTGPISKDNLHRAGFALGGHTELLQELARTHWPEATDRHQSDMLFLHRQFRVLLLTRHVPLARVGEALSVEGVTRSLESLIGFLRDGCDLPHPRLAVMGVNPHAGEIDGTEERDTLIPALDALWRRDDVSVEGPLAADAAFRGLNPEAPAYDAYVAAYHDQGLIPMKLVAGMNAVNVTIGLPFLRTSVSHGTAPDIAGKGKAAHESLIAAFKAAVHLKH